MRIAVYHNLPSGGASRVVFEHVRELADRGHLIDLYTLSTSDASLTNASQFANAAITVPFVTGRLLSSPLGRINQLVRWIDLQRLRHVGARLSGMINSGRYDVCAVYPCQLSISPAILLSTTVPTLYYRHDVLRWAHDPPIERPYLSRTRMQMVLDWIDPFRTIYFRTLESLDRSHMLAATRVVVSSCFVRESLYRTYGVAPSLSRLGVDLEGFQPSQGARSDYVLSVGMIVPAKGYDFLIEGLGRVAPDRRPRLIIVGNMADQREVAYIRDLAALRGVELDLRVMVTQDELLDLYRRARCTIYVPVMESFGLVPLESMACGTPVIGIREGGVRETVIEGSTGLLVDRDAGQLAAAVERLVGDDALAATLARAARQVVVEQWGLEQSIATLEQHLEEVASMGRSGGSAWRN